MADDIGGVMRRSVGRGNAIDPPFQQSYTFAMEKPAKWMLMGLLVVTGLAVGCSDGRRNAVAHFHDNSKAIEEFASFYQSHSGIDYVEFGQSNSVDLWVVDRERFDRRLPETIFKYRLFGVPCESSGVSNALDYAAVSKEIFIRLKDHANRSGCISIQKPFWNNTPVEVEIGYARQNMSKWIFRKFKDGVDITNLISSPPWRDDYVAPLAGKWVLVMAKPAFN